MRNIYINKKFSGNRGWKSNLVRSISSSPEDGGNVPSRCPQNEEFTICFFFVFS